MFLLHSSAKKDLRKIAKLLSKANPSSPQLVLSTKLWKSYIAMYASPLGRSHRSHARVSSFVVGNPLNVLTLSPFCGP